MLPATEFQRRIKVPARRKDKIEQPVLWVWWKKRGKGDRGQTDVI